MVRNAARTSSSRAAGSALSASASVYPTKSALVRNRPLKANQSPLAAEFFFTKGSHRRRDLMSTGELDATSDSAGSALRSFDKMAAVSVGCAMEVSA
ncbi:unnamed protein product [Lampetra planeri]